MRSPDCQLELVSVSGELLLASVDFDAAPPAIVLAHLVELPRHPVASYLMGLSVGSRRSMLGSLHALARISGGDAVGAWSFPWWQLRYAHAQTIRSEVVARFAPATSRKMLAALRGVLLASKKLGLVDGATYREVIDFDPVKGDSLPVGRHLARAELRAMFEACAADARPMGVRDAALLAVACQTGARRHELVALDGADYDAQTGTLRFRTTKGDKPREAFMHDDARASLDRWIDLRGSSAGALFCPLHKSSRILVERRLSDYRFYEVLQARASQAGLEHVTPHDLRRTFGGDLLEKGADLSTVQQLLGHASPATTARYDKRPSETRRRAARLAQVPAVTSVEPTAC